MSVGSHRSARSSHIATSAESIACQVFKQLLHRKTRRRNDIADYCSDHPATWKYPASGCSSSPPYDSSVVGKRCSSRSWASPQSLLVRLCASSRLASSFTAYPYDALQYVPTARRHSTSTNGRPGSHFFSQSSSQVDVRTTSHWLITLVNGVICFDDDAVPCLGSHFSAPFCCFQDFLYCFVNVIHHSLKALKKTNKTHLKNS